MTPVRTSIQSACLVSLAFCHVVAGMVSAQTPTPPGTPGPGMSPAARAAPVTAPTGPGPTHIVPIQGPVSKAQLVFLRRALKEAESTGAGAVVLDMDTPGGELQAAVDMVEALQSTSLPTITYVNRNAGSAGALIALATDRIYMTPVGAIGAAAPVMGGGQDMGETLTDKVVSYYSKYFRSAAEQSGHNPDLAEAFINKEVEVRIGDRVISEKGSLLTLSPQEAAEVIDGQPVLASGIAETMDDLIIQDDISANTVRIEPTGLEVTAFYITLLAPLLLMGGIIGAYIEFKSPGFGIPGVFAAICFLLFFTGHSIAGLSGQEALVVFLLGLLLVIVELIFFPGLLLMALAGVAIMVGAVLWAMIDRYPSEPVVPDFEALTIPFLNLTIAIVGGAFVVALLAQFLPQTDFFKRLSLQRALAGGAAMPEPQPASEFAPSLAVGTRGRAETPLRPSGKARFGPHYIDVVTEGEYLDSGTPVEVASVRRDTTVVRPLPS